jgi:RND family efflux transporter MFP subunit
MRTVVRLGTLMLTVALAAAGCKATSDSGLKKGKTINKMAYPVSVAPLTMKQVMYNVTAPGSLDAYQQVQITARVAGAVDRVSFVEGQTVKQGDLLATIETDRYEVAVDQAKAAVAKAAATESSAEAQLARRQGAVAAHPGLITGEEIATYQTSVVTGKADVAAAKEAQRVAELNLRDAYVRAPIAGVIQSRTVQTGQYLNPGNVLATLLQRDPLLLRFGVTEQDAPRLKAGMMANMAMRESATTYQAKIILVSDSADPTTRLVPVTAQVDDTTHKYWLRPGAFAEVSVPIGNARQAIVVPSLAVQPTQGGNVVYTVDAGNVAHLKNVQLGMYTPEGGVEITQGLANGDLLVVEGFEALSDNSPVNIKSRTTVEAVEAQAQGGDGGAPAPAPAAPVASAAPATTGSAAPRAKP